MLYFFYSVHAIQTKGPSSASGYCLFQKTIELLIGTEALAHSIYIKEDTDIKLELVRKKGGNISVKFIQSITNCYSARNKKNNVHQHICKYSFQLFISFFCPSLYLRLTQNWQKRGHIHQIRS